MNRAYKILFYHGEETRRHGESLTIVANDFEEMRKKFEVWCKNERVRFGAYPPQITNVTREEEEVYL